ncbi:pilus assembly protein PilM [soil metagenome]
MARLFYRDKPIIGIDISSTGVKVMAVDTKKWLVLGYGSIDLEPAKVKEALEGTSTYLSDNIRALVKEKFLGSLPSSHVVLGVPTARSFSRTFLLPISAEKTLKDAVEIEADQYIPIPTATLYIDSEIIERDKQNITVLMSAMSRVIVDNCVKAVESVDLQVVLVEPGMNAVGRLLTSTEDGHLPTVIVDIGPASTDIAVLDNGSIRVTGGLAIGGNTFTLDIAKKLGVTLENAHQLKVLSGLNAGSRQEKIKTALGPSLERIVSETRKVIRYYNERLSDGDTRKLEQLLVVGGGSNLPGIGEYFTNSLVMPARVASPWQKLDFGKLPEPAKQFRSRYITVAGLASVNPGSIWK